MINPRAKVLFGIYHADPDTHLPEVDYTKPTKKIRRAYFIDTSYGGSFIRWGKEYLRADWTFSEDIIHDVKVRAFPRWKAKLIVYVLNKFGKPVVTNK